MEGCKCECGGSCSPAAVKLNDVLKKEACPTYEMMSGMGKRMFFPSGGILAQTAEAKKMAKNVNCSVGMAKVGNEMMHLGAVSKYFDTEHLSTSDLYSYAPPAGREMLRKRWLAKMEMQNPDMGPTSSPIVTNGLTEGLSVLGDLFVDCDDEIIVSDQFWGNYKLMFEARFRAKLTKYELLSEDLKGINVGALEAIIDEKIKAKAKKIIVLLNFPNNPTGYSPSKTEMSAIVKILKKAPDAGINTLVFIDDAYYGMFYENDCETHSAFNYLANCHEKLLACRVDGATKEFFVWGFRVGFLTFGLKGATKAVYSALEQKAMGAIRSSMSNCSMPAQSIIEKVLDDPEALAQKEKNIQILKERAEEVKRVASQEKYQKYWDVYPFNSGYFMLIRVKGADAEEVRKYLLDVYQVGVIRTSPKDIRVAFSCVEKEDVAKVFDLIKQTIEDLNHKYEISDADQKKVDDLGNSFVEWEIKRAVAICKPAKVRIFTDSDADDQLVREAAKENHEERPLAVEGHTIHYDSYYDQARDKAHTCVLLPEGKKLSQGLRYAERTEKLREVLSTPGEFLNGSMIGGTMIVRFFCLGPRESRFSLCALQVTDSYYVAHSESILYRGGYSQFKLLAKQNKPSEFFTCIHSAGKTETIDFNKKKYATAVTAKDSIPDRRIYVDPQENHVYSVNCQYAGNTLACKKLALRLAINKADKEGWLTEHMFLSGFAPITGPEAGKRMTYFTGAYPSACGKTSTAMVPGSHIVGDDIVYIREGPDGEMRAVNIEQGVFGIIKDVNAEDDPIIMKQIAAPNKEVIYSNVLIDEKGHPFWQGMGQETPKQGYNHHGDWNLGDKDEAGKNIPLSHNNARFTVRIDQLDNADQKNLHNPDGVRVDAILYGGRDNDTSVPVCESVDWLHGVFMGASILSRQTAAVIGAAGGVTFNPMANMDFVIVPLGKYISNHINFGNKLHYKPKVFATNYFLQNDKGKFMNTKLDKAVWILWAEGRIHGEFGAIATPIGNVPKYEDLKMLFAAKFPGKVNEVYTKAAYDEQFSLRAQGYLDGKFTVVQQKYEAEEKTFPNTIPKDFWNVFHEQKKALEDLIEKSGKTVLTPADLEKFYPQN